ncbi:hypothetical protein Tco_1443716 [Tanacetum coccineum]
MGLNDLINWYQSHGALDLGSTRFLKNMISMKNEGTAEVFEGTEEVHEGTAQVNESTAEVNESTAEKIKVPLLFVKVPLVLSDISERTACFIRYREVTYLCLNGVDEDLMNLAKVYDLPYDAYYVYLLSLSVYLIEDEDFFKRL